MKTLLLTDADAETVMAKNERAAKIFSFMLMDGMRMYRRERKLGLPYCYILPFFRHVAWMHQIEAGVANRWCHLNSRSPCVSADKTQRWYCTLRSTIHLPTIHPLNRRYATVMVLHKPMFSLAAHRISTSPYFVC